jgi:hypothetical protein
MSKIATTKQAMTTLRSRLRFEETEARRTGAAYATSFVFGAMSRSPEWMTRLRLIDGLPVSATAAIVTKIAASYADGEMADYLNGASDSLASIALFQFGAGSPLATVMGAEQSASNGGHAALEARLNRALGLGESADVGYDDGELSELEGIR